MPSSGRLAQGHSLSQRGLGMCVTCKCKCNPIQRLVSYPSMAMRKSSLFHPTLKYFLGPRAVIRMANSTRKNIVNTNSMT
jgi:hypothetical protein